jgi:hypothetical protein
MNNVNTLIASTVNDTSVFLIRDIYDLTTSRRSMTTLSITVQNATLSMTTLGSNFESLHAECHIFLLLC